MFRKPIKAILLAGPLALSYPAAAQDAAATYRGCEQTILVDRQMANAHSAAILTQRVMFDTTANAFTGLVIDQATGRKIADANIMFTQGDYIFLATTNRKGEFHLIRNEFSGHWGLKIEHKDYVCLVLPDISMGGGIHATLKLHRK